MWDEVLFSQQLISNMDIKGNGIVEFAEFHAACMDIPLYFRCLAEPYPIFLSTEQDASLNINLGMTELCKLWTRGVHASAAHGAYNAIDFRGFKSIVAVLFKMKRSSSVDQQLCKRLFSLFDRDCGGLIDFNEFLRYVCRRLWLYPTA